MPKLRSLFSLRPVAELTLVIIGVMIALAVDAWWDDRQDAKLEVHALRSLLSELSVASAPAQGLIERNTRMIERASRITDNPTALVPGVKLNLQALFASVPYDLRLRTYDELNNSGQFHILSDRELRVLLTDFVAMAKAIVGYEQQMQFQWNRSARPILYRTTSFGGLGADHRVLPDLSAAAKEELRNVIIDRSSFAVVHGSMVEDFLPLIGELESRNSSSFDAD